MKLFIGVLLLAIIIVGGIGKLYIGKLESNGVVIKDEESKKIISLCQNQENWRDCYGKKIGSLNERIPLEQSLAVLSDIQKDDLKTRDCHLIAHYLSISEVEKNPAEWIKIFDHVDQTTCVNGYVHGVMEGRSRFDQNLVLDEKTIPEICSQIEERTSKRVGKTREKADDACAHIIGHILLAEQSGVIENAVKTCAKVPQDIRSSCFDGIFMENITRDNLEIHEVAKKFALTKAAAVGVETMCKNYIGEEGKSCWRELAHLYTSFTQNNPTEVYNLCYQSKNDEYAKECYMHSVNLMVLSDEYSLGKLDKTCVQYEKNVAELEYCMSRTLSPLLGSSIQFIDRAVSFCETQQESARQYCYSKIGQLIKPKTNLTKRKELCEKVPQNFQGVCIDYK